MSKKKKNKKDKAPKLSKKELKKIAKAEAKAKAKESKKSKKKDKKKKADPIPVATVRSRGKSKKEKKSKKVDLNANQDGFHKRKGNKMIMEVAPLNRRTYSDPRHDTELNRRKTIGWEMNKVGTEVLVKRKPICKNGKLKFTVGKKYKIEKPKKGYLNSLAGVFALDNKGKLQYLFFPYIQRSPNQKVK